MNRDAMKELLESKGGKISGSLSAKTSYLLASEGGGSKRDKAEKLGITILDEEEFTKLLDQVPARNRMKNVPDGTTRTMFKTKTLP